MTFYVHFSHHSELHRAALLPISVIQTAFQNIKFLTTQDSKRTIAMDNQQVRHICKENVTVLEVFH